MRGDTGTNKVPCRREVGPAMEFADDLSMALGAAFVDECEPTSLLCHASDVNA